MTAAALALLLWLGTTDAPPPDSEVGPKAPSDVPRAAPPQGHSYLVPALEVGLFNFSILAFNNLGTRADYGLVTWEAMRSRFGGRSPWVFDVDAFVTNQLGHPYQGALAYTAARSSGLPFWQASLYTFFSSLAWELFFEPDPPSTNDQLTTTLGGILLGEAMHRSYRVLIRGDAGSGRRAVAALISPVSAANRWMFDDPHSPSDQDLQPAFFASVTSGISLSTRFVERGRGLPESTLAQSPQVLASGHLLYGSPGDPRWGYRYPLSHFDLKVALAFPGITTANLNVRGLMVGQSLAGEEGRLQGLWGLFGLYDFGSNWLVRVSSVGLGPGTSFDIRVREGIFLRATGVVGAVGFAAAGSLGLDGPLERDYHIGPGVQSVLETRLIWSGRGTLGWSARYWLVSGAYTEPRRGYEAIAYLAADAQLRVWRRLGVGLEVPFSFRLSRFGGEPARLLFSDGARFTLSYLSDEAYGTVLARPGRDPGR